MRSVIFSLQLFFTPQQQNWLFLLVALMLLSNFCIWTPRTQSLQAAYTNTILHAVCVWLNYILHYTSQNNYNIYGSLQSNLRVCHYQHQPTLRSSCAKSHTKMNLFIASTTSFRIAVVVTIAKGWMLLVGFLVVTYIQ